MNLFSQSKLTLKLKKQNNASSTESTNECQKSETSDSIKTEVLSNNCVLAENDSFVEILQSVQTNEEKIPTSQSIFKATLSNQNTSNVVDESKQCPVCLQTVESKNFITHVKSCGTSHNLSSKVLIKAVDLQERQAAEREALGLPKLTKSRDVKKKKMCKQKQLKIGSDSNLDLAIAMSVSLQESKNNEIIKESEKLLEVGLEQEAIEKRKTLENFGFISNQPFKPKPKSFSKTNSLLFKQTKEDREKRITEKVAMILIDDTADSSSELLVNHCPNTKLVSNYLNSIRNYDNKLWKKSLLEEENICAFYVKQLIDFIRPYKSNSIDLNYSAHQNTSKHEPNMMDDKKFTDNLQAIVDYSSINNIYDTSHVAENKILLEHSSKWKSMVGNSYMSDLTIFAKDEHTICGHTLVFHTQCPAILHDIGILETKPCKTKKVLMWLEYSYEACLAFLELIYSGQESRIKPEFREDYLNLGTRYNILMALNDNQKNGWVSNDNDNICKRKSSDLYDNPNDCKRYKASSPDMFMSDDDVNVETCTSINFLGPTVNDEKSLSMLKTKSWLYSQHHNSSFTENFVKNIPPQNNVPKQTPCRSFHSATTVELILSSPSSHCTNPEIHDHKFNVSIKPSTDISLPNLLSTSESDMKDILVLQNISTVTKLDEEPDLITINSDSEAESVTMIWSNDIKKSGLDNTIFNSTKENKRTFLSQSTINNEKNDSLFISCNAKSAKCSNDVNTIELNDNSFDSIHSVCTNKMYQRNYNMPSNCSLFCNSIFNSEDKIINIDDSSNVFSAVTNRLPTNNESTRIFSSNNIIDLIEGRSSDSKSNTDTINSLKNKNYIMPISNNAQQNGQSHSTSFSDVTLVKENVSVIQSDLTTKKYEAINFTLNSSPLANNLLSSYSFLKTDSNKKVSDNLDLNSSNSLGNCILPNNNDYFKLSSNSPKQSFLMDKVSPTLLNSTSNLKMNDTEDNNKRINRLFSYDQNIVEKPNLDSELLENNATTSSILPTNYYSDLGVNAKEIIDCTFLSSNNCKNKPLINTTSPQVDSNQLFGVTIPNENILELNTSNNEQIIDDPWMDYDDYWPPVDLSPRCVTPVLSNSTSVVLLDESEVQTPRKTNLNHKNLELQTLSTISNHSNNMNSQKKKSLTPNKYSHGTSTPKSLRRVQSESVIGSKQITPLPDYSSMKTPDLRKEFDRYGLKDLGRRKGKLILRHIYDVLHPLDPSEKNKCNTEFEQYSSSSDISEHGIPDYEDGSYDELETFNPTNLSNKISVEAGFKQLLKTNEDLHKKILCYEPVWIEELKEDLKQHNVSISMQKLMTFLDDKCVTFRSKSLNDQRQKPVPKKSTKRKKLF